MKEEGVAFVGGRKSKRGVSCSAILVLMSEQDGERNQGNHSRLLRGVVSTPRMSSASAAASVSGSLGSTVTYGSSFGDDDPLSPLSHHSSELSPVNADYSSRQASRSRVADEFTASLVSSGGFVNIEVRSFQVFFSPTWGSLKPAYVLSPR